MAETRTWPIRVLLAKPGLDGHDRGAKVLMYTLREAGMEVIYTGRRAKIAQIVKSALEENVDVIGVSLLNNTHLPICRQLMAALREQELAVPVLVGGIIPKEDVSALKGLGVREVFHVHTPLSEMVEYIRAMVAAAR